MPEASLIITNSGIPGATPEPGFIAFGELTLNWNDSALYFKDNTGSIQTISIRGVPPIQLDRVPISEGPWFQTTYSLIVQKAAGTLPRLKVGRILTGSNNVSTVGTDITVELRYWTTINQLKNLIDEDENASALIYFYVPEDIDGESTMGELPMIESAEFINANAYVDADRADILGQVAIVTHFGNIPTEWAAVKIRPTQWSPRTPGILYNRTLERWERTFIEDGILGFELLGEQE